MSKEKKKKKLGKFSLPIDLIENSPQVVKTLMGYMIVVRAEHMYDSDAIEYTAISDHFAPLEDGKKVPTYTFRFENDGSRISCEKQL